MLDPRLFTESQTKTLGSGSLAETADPIYHSSWARWLAETAGLKLARGNVTGDLCTCCIPSGGFEIFL